MRRLALQHSLRFADERAMIAAVQMLGRGERLERRNAASQLTIDSAGQCAAVSTSPRWTACCWVRLRPMVR